MMPYTPIILPDSFPDQSTMPDLADYMTTAEAAEALGFHVKSVQKMVNSKTLEAIRFGRSWMVSRTSVAEYLDKTKGMSKNDPRRKTAEAEE